MEKMKKSVKIVLISVVSALLVFGIVLGCVLGGRSNPSNPNNPLKEGVLPEQALLFDKINSTNAIENELAFEIDMNDFVDENGEKLDLTDAYVYRENYFLTDNYPYIMVKQYDENNKVYYKGLIEILYKDQNLTKLEYVDKSALNKNIIQIFYNLNGYAVYDFIDLSDINNINSIYQYKYRINNEASLSDLYSEVMSFIKGNMIYTLEFDGFNEFILEIFSITNKSNIKLENISYDVMASTYVSLDDNSYYFVDKLDCYFGFNSSNEIKSYKITLNEGQYYSFKIQDNTFFVNNETENKVSIYFDNMNSVEEVKTISIDSGYESIELSQINSGDYIYIFYKNQDNEKGVMKYFDSQLNEIVEYEANSFNDTIIYNKDNKILLNESGIMKLYNSKKAISFIKFQDLFSDLNEINRGFQVQDSYVYNDDIFILNSIIGSVILNFEGEFLFDNVYSKVVIYSDGYCYAIDNNNFIIDLNNKKSNLIENFSENNELIYSGLGLYFTNNKDNYSMLNYKGELIYDNIDSYSYESILFNSSILKFIINNKEYNYLTNVRFESVNVDESTETTIDNYKYVSNNNEVTGYGDASCSHTNGTRLITFKFNFDEHFYIKKYNVKVDTAAIGGYEFWVYCEYNYEKGTYTFSHGDGSGSDKYSYSSLSISGNTATVRVYMKDKFDSGLIPYYEGNSNESLAYCYINSYSFKTNQQYDSSINVNNTNYGYKNLADDHENVLTVNPALDGFIDIIVSSFGFEKNSKKYYSTFNYGELFGITSYINFGVTSSCIGAELLGYSNLSTSSYNTRTVSRLHEIKKEYFEANNSKYTVNDYLSSKSAKTYYTYAIYSQHTTKVTIKYNNGSGDTSLDLNYGDWLNLNNYNPTRDGYIFTGWTITGLDSNTHYYGSTNNKSSCTTSKATSLTINDEVKYIKHLNAGDNSSVTISANWVKRIFTIYLDYNIDNYYNPGNLGSLNNFNTYYQEYKDAYYYYGGNGSNYWYKDENAKDLLPTLVVKRLGYTFDGYYTDANPSNKGTKIFNSSGESVDDEFFTKKYKERIEKGEGGDVKDTIYAHWTENKYNIQFVFTTANNTAYLIKSNNEIVLSSNLKQITNTNAVVPVFTSSITNTNGRTYYTASVGNIDPGYKLCNLKDKGDFIKKNNLYLNDSAYKHVGWVLYGQTATDTGFTYYYKFNDENNEIYYYKKGNTSTQDTSYTLENYLNFLISDSSASEIGNTIYLYALYEVRDYQIQVNADSTSGSTSENNGINGGAINNDNQNVEYTIVPNYTIPDDYPNAGSTYNDASNFEGKESIDHPITNIALGSTITFTITLIDENGVNSYAIKSIEFLNFPKFNGSSYSRKEKITVDIYGKSNIESFNSSANHNVVSFTYDSNDPNKITITITNLSYPSDSNGGTFNENSVNYTGVFGFTIKVYATPIKENVDGFSISGEDKIDNGANAANAASTTIIPNGGYVIVPAEYDANNKIISYWIDGVPKSAKDVKEFPAEKNGVYFENYGDSYVAYVPIDSKTRANFGNSEIYFIEPTQSIIYYVNDNEVNKEGVCGLNSSSFYEPNSYLSTLSFSGVEFTLKLTKDITNSSSSNNLSYGNPTLKLSSNDGKSESIGNSNFTSSYVYNGVTYTIIEGYELKNGSELINGNRYYLYLGYDEDEHRLLYILVGEGSSDNKGNLTNSNSITFTMSDFSNSLNINISNSISGDNYGETDNGAFDTFIAGANNGNIINSLPNNILPSSTIVIRISPNDGYLINSISLKVGDRQLMNLSLATGFSAFYSASEKNISFVNKNLIGQENTQDANTINYTGEISSLTAFSDPFRDPSNKYGIFYADHADDAFETTTNFESIYILISGIYQNVTVDVKTISYFELDFDVGESDISSKNDFKDKLSIASVSGDTYTSISSSDNIIYEVLSSGGTVIYRVKFFGLASSFKDGIAFFLSGEDYSYTFSNAKYYYGSTEDPFEYDFNRVTSVANSTGSIYINGKENTECLLFEVNSANKNINLKEFFSKSICWSESKINSGNSSDTGNSSDKGYIFNRKYTLLFTVKNHKTNMNTGSWLSVPNGIQLNKNQPEDIIKEILVDNTLYYQPDNPYTKVDTWFNDTVVTNIDYYLNGSGTASKKWQQFFTNGDGTDTETSLGSISSISGYGIKIRYYQIPGYYLERIGISNSQTDGKETFFSISNYSQKSSDSDYVYYYFKYGYERTTGTYIDIYLYISGNDFDSNARSLRLLADSCFTINLYSRQYTIDVTLDANVNYENISSIDTLTTNNKLTLTYDRIATIDATFSMTGYTFVGWANDSGYNYDTNAGNIWSSVSSWTDYKNQFSYLNRLDLLTLTGDGSRAFMVANGFFITDTGFASNSSVRNGVDQSPQNYNFWSAFINSFKVFDYSSTNDSVGGIQFDNTFKYDLTLYGIWKANTYYVQLNLNDVNSGNGSTDAQAKMNGGSTFDSIGKGEILPGELTYGNKTYYLYVVFDTNNWYMLADSNFSIYSNNALSIGDFFNASNNYFIDFKSFIIDRYGYTWLGWFSEQIENAFEPSEYSYYKNNENYPTIADLIDSKNTDDKVITSTSAYGSSKDFTVFNYTLYSKNLSGNVSEISTNHFNYSGEQNALKNYKNEIIESYNEKCQNTDIYFYIYSSSGSETKDYLNSNNLDVTYFDTVFNYDYYIKTTDSQGNTTYKFEYKSDLTGDVYKSTYRYLTLYAYWETNLYTVEVNYMDSESGNSVAGVMGSTSVSKSNNKFLPAYFDDAEFAERLKTFLPVRIGYDFVGWTFYPTITYKTEDDNQVVDTITYSAIDNSNLALYLNSDFRNYLFVQNTKEVMNIGSSVNSYLTYLFNGTDAREKLGDEESYHYVYLFAVWNVQTFTINISLNIDGSDLLNLYDFDSEFALSLYNSSSNDKIPVSYLKENGLTANTLDEIAKNTFTNIVANIEFVINFDEPFSSARLYIGSRATNYTLSDLFATSLGYYFTGWFADPSTQIKIVENTTNSTFDSNGNIVSGLTNTLTGTHTINNYKFDLDMYNDLFVQTHENSVSNDKQYLNYVDYNGAQIHYTEEDDYFTTIGSSTNKSTNFGYVTGTDYYISVEKVQSGYTMYYVDSAGKKTEIVPYIVEKNSGFDTSYSAKFIANLINANDTGGTARFTFDENSFYFDGYTVKFDSISSDEEQNAYYVSTNYGEMTKIIIRFAVKGTNSDLNLNNITGLEQCNVTLTKTRQFTLYAGWEIKDDLNINISNGNIGSGVDPETYGFELGDDQSVDAGQTSNANYGLAGFYFIKGTGENNNSLSISQTESNIDLGFTFYDDIQLFIAPYFNGRFLSEISFEFYAYEQQSDNTIKKVTYVFTLNFDWDSTIHNIRCSSIRITRDNVNLAINGDIINYGNANVTNVYSSDSSNNGAIRNDLAVSGIPILSLLDQTAFDRNGQSKLFEISSYISDLINYSRAFSGSGLINDRTEEMNGRTDVNYINIRLNALMTSVKIDCKFAVQTYNLEVYNVFDPLGNTLETLSDATYSKVAYSNLNDFAANSKSALSPSGSFTYGGVAESVSTSTYSFSSEQRVATIPTNVSSTSVSSTTYSVPYGYYIYGQYKSANDRPVDVAYDKDKNSGYNTSEYTGYGYIYEVGIYNYGGTSNAITNNKIDTHSDQCSPILGSKTLFAKSVRESSSLYTFVSWYIPILDEENGFILTEYNQQREETRIAENIILFGYYYANNKPTSLQFYTWNDTTNSYEQYKNNIDEYTLQSNTNSYRFDNTNTELEINGTFSSEDEILGTYITDDKRIILFENESFGVDVASFGVGSSIYTMAEISNNDTNKSFLEDNVIRNYWFYRYYYTYVNVFAKVDGATVSRAVRYDIYGETTTGQLNGTSTTTEARLHFYYLIDENGEDIQTNRRYIQLFSDNLKDDSFIIYVNDVSQTGNIIVLSDYVTLNSIKNDPTLNIETATVMQEYSYYLTGSNMYAYVPVGGSSTEIDKYYLINKIEDYASDSNLTDEEKALLSTFYQYDEVANKHIYSDLTARFYAKIQGELYFLLATTSSESYNATTWYKYQPTGFESDGTKYNISNYEINFNQTNYTVKPIENYLDDELTADQRNILELHYDGSNYLTDARYYFFINDKTAYFLFDTLDSNGNGSLVNIYTYSLAGFITTNSYSIVNLDNYFMKVEDDYYAVEFTQRYDSDGSLYYNPYETNNTCVFNGTTYYFNYSNKLFYLDSSFENRLSTNSLSHTVYTPVNKNYVVKLSLPENPKDTDAWEYLGVNINSLPSPNIGFWYNNNSYGYVGYIDFKQSDISYMSSTVVSTEFSYERDNEGNIIKERMYDVFEKYINTVFTSKDLTFREELLDAVKKKCEAYTFDDLQKTLITVDKFFTTDNTNSVYQVDLIIPVTFDLTISSGETYSITVSIKYRTSIITSSTTIEETIYAIPIYSRNVMEYTDESVKVSNDTVIEITPDDMYVVYFENVGNIDTRYYNADDGNYLEFAILNEMQYGMLTSSLNYPDELTYLLNKYAPTILYQCDNGSTVVNKTVSYDFGSLENGTYYVVAYYKKMDNYNYVIRSSDNVIKVVVSGSDGNKQVEYTLI